MESTASLGSALFAAALVLAYAVWPWCSEEKTRMSGLLGRGADGVRSLTPGKPRPVLECIRKRASVFPRSYVKREVPRSSVERLLEAAMWAPYHGPKTPWRFVVLGKQAMREMQHVTLSFYDENWESVPGFKDTAEAYGKWRDKTEAEIDGRWGPVSYMVGITVQRQAGSKRMPMWEEECATAAAVQNMHLQATAEPGLACYWSSWHAAARDSREMSDFLGMKEGDRCLGFFIVAACDPDMRIRRSRRVEDHLKTEWRD